MYKTLSKLTKGKKEGFTLMRRVKEKRVNHP
jgi:hypothetical protein